MAGAVFAAFGLSACEGPQSAFGATGADAIQLETLFIVMLVGAAILWVAVNGLFFYVTRVHTTSISRRLANGVIIGGGIGLPLVVVTALLVYGLSIMPDQRAEGDGLVVKVTGEKWWWRTEYQPLAGAPVVSANEIRLPTGSRTTFELTSERVIHSFWIPKLGGKMDMFPGRTTVLTLEPVTPGIYRGQCAEFCGESHALMAFKAVVMEPDAFDAWLEAEAAPIQADPQAPGAEIFFGEGCGACHALRGTQANGAVGPDLTHLATRESLAAAALPMNREALAKWVRNPETYKPGVKMPAYDHLSDEELDTLAGWLMELK
ncbi:cytochrome c oxidase subunit II [Profundibacterium mesophilum]|uniref:cytochrome c oxidase subunit II n=1 Tax=Profundibacterium mesophilum TaxID=1258573 RepID=UPI001F1B1500|nr:cytochrome c oxidase subunit II [Profundibacterium mesophilum]